MKKPKLQSWLFPICLFIFFSIYLLVKFLFVFFLSAAYEPAFIYQMTPFYLLSGVSNIQLLSLSLVLLAFDLYLHLRGSKRRLLLSFLPTSLMITGLGYSIMFNPPGVSYIFHYGLFGCLVFVLLIDYQHVLHGAEPFAKLPIPTSIIKVTTEPDAHRKKFFLGRPAPPPLQQIAAPQVDNVSEFQKASEVVLQRMQFIVDDLERKLLRIEQVANKVEYQTHNNINKRISIRPSDTSFQMNEKDQVHQKNLMRDISEEEKIILKEKIENHLIIDEMNDLVAVVQRGIFKEISNSFAGFLGYKRYELLQKNFFVFVAPRGFDDAKKYYLNRLKGVTSNSFRTVLRTKTQTELFVEITVTPTVYKGDSAEFLCIKEVKNVS